MVVGAGLAGLVCADQLERAGRRVTILEARNRPGGRVYTVRKNFASGQHAEGGGEFIEPGHGFMRLYAKRFGLGLEDLRTEPDSHLRSVVYLDRRHLGAAQLEGATVTEVGRFWQRVRALAAPLDPVDPIARGADLDRRSAVWLLDSMRIGGTARTLVEHELRQRFTVEPDKLSLLFLCQTVTRAGTQDLAAATFRIRGGNDQLPSALAHGLADLRLQAVANRIELSAGRVRVVAKGGDVHARLCVLTAPFPAVTNLIEFSPALPPLLREAILRLRYGVTTKIALQYSRRFWRARDESGRIVTDLTFQSTWEATSGQGGSSGILVANSAGRPGALYAGRYSSTRPLLAADEIDDVYPGSRRLYTQSGVAAWLNELPSGGAIAAYAPGQVTRYWDVVRKRHGRLLLAGEHTDSYCGTMEGAVRSGRRAAAAANALL